MAEAPSPRKPTPGKSGNALDIAMRAQAQAAAAQPGTIWPALAEWRRRNLERTFGAPGDSVRMLRGDSSVPIPEIALGLTPADLPGIGMGGAAGAGLKLTADQIEYPFTTLSLASHKNGIDWIIDPSAHQELILALWAQSPKFQQTVQKLAAESPNWGYGPFYETIKSWTGEAAPAAPLIDDTTLAAMAPPTDPMAGGLWSGGGAPPPTSSAFNFDQTDLQFPFSWLSKNAPDWLQNPEQHKDLLSELFDKSEVFRHTITTMKPDDFGGDWFQAAQTVKGWFGLPADPAGPTAGLSFSGIPAPAAPKAPPPPAPVEVPGLSFSGLRTNPDLVNPNQMSFDTIPSYAHGSGNVDQAAQSYFLWAYPKSEMRDLDPEWMMNPEAHKQTILNLWHSSPAFHDMLSNRNFGGRYDPIIAALKSWGLQRGGPRAVLDDPRQLGLDVSPSIMRLPSPEAMRWVSRMVQAPSEWSQYVESHGAQLNIPAPAPTDTMGLNMREPERLMRAWEQGYTQPLFRGTQRPTGRQFHKGGGNFGISHVTPTGWEVYTTPMLDLATRYAGYAGHGGRRGHVTPYLANLDDYLWWDGQGKQWSQVNIPAMQEAVSQGRPGVKIANVYDAPAGSDIGFHSGHPPHETVISFDGRTIGHFGAAFRPDRRSLMPDVARHDLFKGIAPPVAAGSAGLGITQRERERYSLPDDPDLQLDTREVSRRPRLRPGR